MEESPTSVMVVAAHPDDAEFACAATVAKWSREGRFITYVICTNGDKGSSDPEMTSERLAKIREEEQRHAAAVLGVGEVVFLGYPDGGLEDTREFRGKLVKLLRQYKPYTVMTFDPFRRGFPHHRDHRTAGQVALDAIYPYARDRLHYPEHLAEGLTPHKVREVYLWGSEDPDTFIDIKDSFAQKVEALRCHKSQIGSPGEELENRMREWAGRWGERAGVPLAEAFRRIELRP